MEDELAAGDVLSRTLKLIAARPVPALIGLLALVPAGIVLDLTPDPDLATAINFAISLVGLFAQFLITVALMRGTGALGAGERAGSAASFVGASIVTGLGVVFGVLLLVLPGIYLWARWSIVMPLIVGERMTMGDAMRESAERARGRIVAIGVAAALLGLPWLAAVGLYFWYGIAEVVLPLALSIAINLLLYVPQIASWYCAVAVHALTRRDAAHLEDVFA